MTTEYCHAGSSDNYRITHKDVPGGRVLVCAQCSQSFPWGGPEGVGDGLPYHKEAETKLTKEEIIAAYKAGDR